MLETLPNEWLFYGGLSLALACVLIGIVLSIVFFCLKRSLNKQFDKEYGEKLKR